MNPKQDDPVLITVPGNNPTAVRTPATDPQRVLLPSEQPSKVVLEASDPRLIPFEDISKALDGGYITTDTGSLIVTDVDTIISAA